MAAADHDHVVFRHSSVLRNAQAQILSTNSLSGNTGQCALQGRPAALLGAPTQGGTRFAGWTGRRPILQRLTSCEKRPSRAVAASPRCSRDGYVSVPAVKKLVRRY